MKRSRTKAAGVVLSASALSLSLAACGEISNEGGEERQPVSLTLDFYPNPDHAGIYMAQKLGYFEEAGLDVSISAPAEASVPIKQAASGQSDLAITYEPEVALAREQGLEVVAIGAIVDRPLTSMIWLAKSGIKSVAGLKGKTIATAGIPYQDAFLKTILARAKLTPSDVTSVNVGFGLLPALVSGSAQAMLGGYSNVEGVDLRERGLAPVITPVDQLGVPTYDELVLVANRKKLEEEPEEFRLFIAALERGTRAAIEKPNEATEAILEANDALEPKLTKAEVEATLPLLTQPAELPQDSSSSPTDTRPFGYMDPDEWEAFAGWMRDNELVQKLFKPSELLSNDYLPGAIPE